MPLPSHPHGSPHGLAGAGHWPPAPFSSAVSWRRCQTRKCSILPTILTGGKSSCFPSLRNLAIFLLKFGIKLFRTTEFLFFFCYIPIIQASARPRVPRHQTTGGYWWTFLTAQCGGGNGEDPSCYRPPDPGQLAQVPSSSAYPWTNGVYRI